MSESLALPDLPRDRRPRLGMAASLGMHAAFALALVWVSPLRPLMVPAPRPVAVDIVTEQQYRAMTAPAAPIAEPAAPPQVSAPAPAAATTPALSKSPASTAKTDRGVVTATQFYAAHILNEPGMERIRAALGRIDPTERIVQLCNIEGLEQIRRAAPAYDPDTLVSYAMADTMTDGMKLSAPGGAFRSRRQWYEIAFDCTVTADYSGVAAFSFKLGAPIPEDQWEDHNLNAEDADE